MRVLAFYANNFTFHSVVNTLFQSLSKFWHLKDERSLLFTRIYIALMEFDFQKNHVSLLCEFFNALG